MKRLRQLRVMVKRAQAILAGARTGIDWHAPVWNTARWLARRESEAGVQLRYVLAGTRKKHGDGPLATPFADFSKAIVVLLWARSRSNTGPYRWLCALRHLYGVLQRRGATEPSELRPEDLFDACIAYQAQCRSTGAAHILGTCLKRIAEEADNFEITATPLHFRNPAACRRKDRPTWDLSLTKRIDAEKLPSLEALAAYAECTNRPLNDDERILLRATDLHIALGTRIGEALTIPLDCWVEEEIQEPRKQGVRSGTSSAPTKRYGIRYYAEKGYDLAIDWLPFQDVPLVRRAVTELTDLCAPARAVAHWLESNPRRLWDYLPDTLVPVSELLTHLRYKHAEAFMLAMRTRGIQVAIPRLHGERKSESYYRAGDIEKAYAQSATRLAAISGEGGHIRLKLSDALCVKFHGQFSFDHSFRNYRHPELITASDVRRALGGAREASVFDRRGLTIEGPEGKRQRIKIRPHSTRHWKNALYDLGGMTDLQQSWAMHRKSAQQTKVYQHRTIQEQTDMMRHFLELTHTERVAHLRDAIRDGKIAGPLADAYSTLRLRNPTGAESFLQTYASGIHITPWGICANDFTLSPCRKYLQCYDNCRHYHRTANPDEQRRLLDLRERMTAALKVMNENAVGEAGSGKWVEMMEKKLAGLERALAVWPGKPQQPPLQVFPEWADCSYGSETSSV